MNTAQIHLALSHKDNKTKNCFVGVFAEDMLPRTVIDRKQFCLIFNTQPSNQPGQHWIAIYIYKEKKGTYKLNYFDSNGEPPRSLNVINFLRRYSNNWTYNSYRLQGNSKVCGQYCIMFLSLLCRGVRFKQFLRYFTRDSLVNDRIVFDYVCKNYNQLC